MHVALIGAGALGRIYGVHLADAGARVSFVVRPARIYDSEPFVVERRTGDRRQRVIPSPVRVDHVPADASVVLLAVRADQLDRSVESLLTGGPEVPLVALTPLLPLSLARVDAWVGGRCRVAMPTVAASDDGSPVVRFWSFRAAPTLFERNGGSGREVVEALVQALVRSGLPAKLSDDVRRRNPATTIAFFPISVAVSRAGGVRELREDRRLLELGARAARETFALAREIGPVTAPAAFVARAIGPSTLRSALGVALAVLPSAAGFIDSHFGSKLSAQHRVLGAEILELARQRGHALPSLELLLQS